MQKIYLGQRCFIIGCPSEKAHAGTDAIEFQSSEETGLEALVEMAQNPTAPRSIFIPSDRTQETYRRLCSLFKEVNAAGGLVSDSEGNVLLIRRNGLWDLPKGHQEAGEDISVTAVREVREETGADMLELRSLICITDHCYLRDGIWHLKHTWWYDMLYTGISALTPQTEEDITDAVWVAKSDITSYMQNTYPSIVEVFGAAGI